ncbi:hypothetical protein AAP_04910 [Ascosphaera apis ARSEF 7405]|uniref:Uncharacterized protein n=1 Tax=Ascosphaera apis ARSEF 7405 TaxID=392613 RepID=A0A167WA85_9EURO|nr:hypothetical protein AAP_04910 [Ascosphaera apis ARSEF 7405]
MALCSPQEFNTPTMQKQFETSDMNDCSFILCIDEARTLLRMYSSDNVSQFVSFRNGARHAFGKCSFFAILLDTTSHVSNFAPAAKLKPSQRTPDYAQLFPPIYAINTFDAFADPEDGSLPVFDATEISAIRLFKLGRPLWGAFLDNGASLRVTQDLARTKLGPADDDDFPLVLMAHRISIQASDYALADFLVSRCMRYIFYINPSRSLLWTHYASEPILAFQAARAMRTPARRLQALQRLVLAHSRGSVDLGDVGEMIAAIILLWTMDSFMEKSDFPSSVAVHRFLEALLGTEVAKKMHISIQPNSSLVNIWENGKIYFNHVCRSLYHDSRSFPSTLLRQAYRRGAAVFFPRNFAGADIGIPVALPGNKFTAILIQVKNRVDGGTQQSQRLLAQDSIRTAQRVISGLGDCMGLMMSLYREREKGRAVVWPDKVARVSPRFIESQPSTTTDIFTALIAGLNHDIYPSVCPAGYQEREQIFELLRVLRDHDPIHRLRECDDQSLRMVNNIFFGVTEPHQDPMDLDP